MQKKENSDAFGMFETVLIAAKHKVKILLISLLGSFLCFCTLLFFDDQYTSSTTLKLRAQENAPEYSSNPFGDLSAIARGQAFSADLTKEQIGTLTGLLSSRSFFLNHILQIPDILPIILAFKNYDSATQKNIFDETIYDVNQKQWLGKYSVLNNQENFTPIRFNSFNTFFEMINFNYDKDTALFYISVTHPSPIFAKNLLDAITTSVNSYMQRKQIIEAKKSLDFLEDELNKTLPAEVQLGISSLVYKNINKKMLASIEKEDYYFEVIDDSHIPINKSWPNRPLICILFFIFTIIFQLLLIGIINAFRSDYAKFQSGR